MDAMGMEMLGRNGLSGPDGCGYLCTHLGWIGSDWIGREMYEDLLPCEILGGIH